MAVAQRATAVVPTGNPTTGFTCVIPATVQADDIITMHVTSRDHTAGTALPTCTDNDVGGNAWTLKINSSDRKALLFWKRATSGTAGKTVTIAGCVGSSSGVLVPWSGCATTGDPIPNATVEDNASGDETHAGFTPESTSGHMIVGSTHNTANDNAVTNNALNGVGTALMGEKLSTGGSDCATNVTAISSFSSPTGNYTWAQTDGTTKSILIELKDPDVVGGATISPYYSSYYSRMIQEGSQF